MAVRVSNFSSFLDFEDVETYLNIGFKSQSIDFSNVIPKVKVMNETDVICSTSRFLGETEMIQDLDIPGKFKCLKEGYSYSINGSFTGKYINFLRVVVDYCTQSYLQLKYPGTTKVCKSRDQTDKLILEAQVDIYMLTQYFDDSEFE